MMGKGRLVILIMLFLLVMVPAAAQQDTYEIPEPPEDVDLSQVIARVGDETITLGDFAKRMRYERIRYYRALRDLAEQQGESVLELDAPQNRYARSIRQALQALATYDALPSNVYQTLLVETIYHQEAQQRDIEVTECDVNSYWVRLLGMEQEFQDCELPEGFEEEKQAFLDDVQTYAGMEPETVERAMRISAEYEAVNEVVGQEVQFEPEEAVRTRHIRVQDEETANEVIQRLEEGDDFDTLLQEYTADSGVRGDQGDLDMMSRDSMTQQYGQAFTDAVVNAESGELVGPVEAQNGYHIIRVQEKAPRVTARHILVETEDEANRVLDLVQGDADFATVAQNFSIDSGSARQGGSLGTFGPGQMAAPFEEAAFNADVGEIVGPVETEFGYHVIEVTDRQSAAQLDVQHIQVDSEEAAQEALGRIEGGESFGTVAAEMSTDPDASGNRGDTLSVFTQGSRSGLYVRGETLPQLEEAVFSAEPGEVVGPIETSQAGYFIVKVEEFGERLPSEQQQQTRRDSYIQAWSNEQLESERVETTNLWKRYVPEDPMPSEYSEVLAPLDEPMQQALDQAAGQRESTNLLNVLAELEVVTTEEDADSEASGE